MTDYIIDAKNKPLGRLASQIAILLQGKNLPSYEPRKVGGNRVVVKNVEQLKVTGKKMSQKIYYRHSSKPGHLKQKKLKDAFQETPERVLSEAVRGMLPRNKLRNERLKLLIIEKNG
jgi:large subunit ribosomal protein L13